MSTFFSWKWGIWAVNFGRRPNPIILTVSLAARWNPPLFSERNRIRCDVLPLGFGWRLRVC